ncbi:DUF4145 domain-containing protein [Peribacillus alkalitolerans]|uniref:DUF4145 domain-containing protein n=1 Tax=Peribacillus alkalitolerans TaxID=1550385 RepID=UPI0013D6DC74|nr:DUF4145 domain-containing protein [Peribacillus alkalitolerans]
MTNKIYSSKSIICLHCGNETIMEVSAKVNEKEYEYMYDDYHGEDVPVATYYTTYTLYKCPVCSKITLKSVEAFDADTDHRGRVNEYENILYPVQTGDLKFVPERIKGAYESALKTKNVDRVMCAIGLRRTLEMLCHDQGAEGRTLYNRLVDLSEKAIIPKVLDKVSHLIRDLGNSAAHAEDVEFDMHVINDLIRFTRIILDYVYVIPKELRRIQEQFDLNEEV